MAKKSRIEKVVDQQKKKHPIAFGLVVLFFVLGIGAGFITLSAITQNDKFEIVGTSSITLNVGESPDKAELGAIAIEFGKDISDKIVVTNNIDSSKPGCYYYKYTIDSMRYKGVVKYRYVIYKEVENV